MKGSPDTIEQYNANVYTEDLPSLTMSKDTELLFHLSNGIVLSNFDGCHTGLSSREARLHGGTEANINMDTVLSHIEEVGGKKILRQKKNYIELIKNVNAYFVKKTN